MRTINEIIIHCTATRASQKVTVADVTRWHKQRGFATIGYHYLVDQAGNVFPGRPEATPGAHCLGHNAKSIGIAYCGGLDASGKPADTRTEPQRAALLGLLTEPNKSIHPHLSTDTEILPRKHARVLMPLTSTLPYENYLQKPPRIDTHGLRPALCLPHNQTHSVCR